MKFIQKDYLGTKQILKFTDHYVAMSVMVSDQGVERDEYGEKIIPAGTIVGGGVLSDVSKMVLDINTGAVAASHTTTFSTENSNIVIMAREKGVTGNAIKIALVAPITADQSLSVTVTGKTITVSLATDSSKAISSIVNDVIEVIMEHAAARTLVDVKPATGNNGTGIVTALAETALTGGIAGTGGAAEGVLMNDVDVTYGPNTCAMIIHGFIDTKKIPNKPTAADITALKQIIFLG